MKKGDKVKYLGGSTWADSRGFVKDKVYTLINVNHLGDLILEGSYSHPSPSCFQVFVDKKQEKQLKLINKI